MSSSRRKLPPSPIARGRDLAPARSLAPATMRSFALPTVAALMLVAAGCASKPTAEHIERDEPKTVATETTKAATTPTTTTAASAMIGGATMVQAIDPDPQQMDGQIAMVKPAPKGPPKTPGHIAPVTTPKHLGGDVAPTFP